MKNFLHRIDRSVLLSLTREDLNLFRYEVEKGMNALKSLAERHNPYLTQAYSLFETAELLRQIQLEIVNEIEDRAERSFLK